MGISIILTGCNSSISQEDYDAKVSELKIMQEKYSEKSTELETIQKELTKLKTKNAKNEMEKAGAKAWVKTAFGDDAQTIINDNDLYVNIPKGYTISEKSIESLWNKVLSSLSLYRDYYKETPDQLPYDSITIIVLEEETGLDMVSFQILKNTDGTFTQTAVTLNIDDYRSLVPYFSKAIQ